MKERPIIDKQLDAEFFRSYYYLKEELVAFCRSSGLPTAGGKMELTDRIARYLATGEIQSVKCASKPKGTNSGRLSEEALIESDFVCSEKHRAFFKDRIGRSFSFNVSFQNWLKANAGKTYAQAIEAYHEILAEKKKGATTIDKQFEYNTYIRAFFEDNPGKSLKQAILCWNYKKARQGHNAYERTDLTALEG